MSWWQTGLVWTIVAGAIACILLRPKRWPEAVWACLAAGLLLAFGLVPAKAALNAVAAGTDVYLFLAGMMLLAELARQEGVFDWMASLAVGASKGSAARLFALVYLVGIVVTVLLSNDATAVVLTPAVYAAVKKARAHPESYLFICAFIANAASFVLPISNPANLVVYGKSIPPLADWLRTFGIASVCSIAITYAVLRWTMRAEIGGAIERAERFVLSSEGRRAAWGIAFSAAAMIAASALDLDLGLPTCIAAVLAVTAATGLRARALRRIAAGVSWSVLPLVAGLFVLVEGLNRAGTLEWCARALDAFGAMPRAAGALAASFGIAALSNVMNNLPSGLLARGALESARAAWWIRDATLVGVDLGPNLSVTGSLATILWLIALRREGIEIGAVRFLKLGMLVMPPALLAATLAIALAR